jgi:hypothetical protein
MGQSFVNCRVGCNKRLEVALIILRNLPELHIDP